MFDPSFFELIVICVVALLVLGPDKLPGAIKTLGLWIGRLRRSFNNIRREIEQEVGADEIRRQLRNEAIMEKFNSTKNQVTQSIQSVKDEAESIKKDLDVTKELSDTIGDAGDKTTGADEDADDFDPVEKLATRDPSARVLPDELTGKATPKPAAPEPSTPKPSKSAKQESADSAATPPDNTDNDKAQ